ncbi:MAG: transposase, partial [Candidatus Marinimicrobia bacterium]|nr:transposase [Candidatus Neomarinimicrobiota bacterium]
MNKLKTEKKILILKTLVEGNSIRSIERMTGVHRDTILRLLYRVGRGCENLLDERMTDLDCHSLQVDEIWAYVGKKQGHLTQKERKSRP